MESDMTPTLSENVFHFQYVAGHSWVVLVEMQLRMAYPL